MSEPISSYRVVFCSAHRLYREDLSPDQNWALYGKCTYDFGHGHNYELEVDTVGIPAPELKRLVDLHAHDEMDHKNLNFDVPALKGVNPTAEWLVVRVWKMLEPKFPRGALKEVRIRETANNQSIYRGESMNTVYITRRAHFSAAHRLYRSEWNESKNLEVFGKCTNPKGHGHNYVLDVTLKAPIDPKTDMVMNLVELKKIIESEVLKPLDHRHLDEDCPILGGIVTTAENLAVAIWGLLEPKIPNGWLYEVKLQETENNTAIYRGPHA